MSNRRKKKDPEFEDKFKGRKGDHDGEDRDPRKGSKPGFSRANAKDFEGRAVKHEMKSAPAVNHPSYYYPKGADGEKMADTTYRTTFNQFLGMPVDFGVASDSVPFRDIPAAICRYEVNPAAGWTDPTVPSASGLNKSMLKMYYALSADSGRTSIYAPQDVGMGVLAFGQVIAICGWISRAFGLYFKFSQRNRTVPQALFEAAGFDYADFRANYKTYLVEFQTIVNLANEISIPDGFEYFELCAKIYSGVYTDDDDSAMAQAYLLVPNSTWRLNETLSPQGAGLETVPLVGPSVVPPVTGTMTMSTVLTILDSMVNNLLTSATMNKVYPDVIRHIVKVRDMQRYQMTLIDENYRIEVSHDKELESWLHNCMIIGAPNPSSLHQGTGYTNENDVMPDANNNCITYRPQFELHGEPMPNGYLIDFDHEEPTRDELIEAIRLAPRFLGFKASNNNWYSQIAALPPYYVTNAAVYYADGVPGLPLYRTVEDISVWVTRLEQIAALSKFDWAPLLYVMDASSTTNHLSDVIGDLDFYTLLDYKDMLPMHDLSYLGLFDFGA